MRSLFRFVLIVLALCLAALPILAQDATPEPTTRPYIGVRIAADDAGVRIVNVVPDSPADQAGLQRGDVITEFNGQPATVNALTEAVANANVGDTLELTVQRGSETLTVSVTLTELPLQPAMGQRPYIGVRLDDSADGVVIREVAADSPAEAAGLQVGDVIVAVDGTPVTGARETVAALRTMTVDQPIELTISRDGEEQQITITPVAQPVEPMIRVEIGGLIFDGANWIVGELAEDSALYAAGLRSGDVITAVDGAAADPRVLVETVMRSDADTTITLTVERGGETQEIAITAGALRDALQMPGGFGDGRGTPGFGFGPGMGDGWRMMGMNGYLGVEFVTLDAAVAAERGTTATEGALISVVVPDSPAAQAGLQEGDVITAVNGEPVDSERTLRDRLFAYEPDDTITLTLERDGAAQDLEVTLGQPPMMEGMPFPEMGGPFGERGERFGEQGRRGERPFGEMPCPQGGNPAQCAPVTPPTGADL